MQTEAFSPAGIKQPHGWNILFLLMLLFVILAEFLAVEADLRKHLLRLVLEIGRMLLEKVALFLSILLVTPTNWQPLNGKPIFQTMRGKQLCFID